MSDRSQLISRLLHERDFRASYIRAKLDVLIPSQLRALRDEKTQSQIAEETGMKQARISAMETPGLVNFNRETLVRMAATHNVGLVVKFVPFSEMLEWENEYSQDTFSVTRLSEDIDFLQPKPMRKASIRFRPRRRTGPRSAWFSQSVGANTHNLRIQQSSNAQPVVQMNFSFESFGQNAGTRELVEMVKHNSSTGSVKFNLQNTATGAQPNVAAA